MQRATHVADATALHFLGDVGGYLLHFRMDAAVGNENFRIARTVGAPGKIAGHSTGFFYEQDAGSSIPGFEAEFPKSIEAPTGDGTKIERGGAIAAHAVRPQRIAPVIVDVSAL